MFSVRVDRFLFLVKKLKHTNGHGKSESTNEDGENVGKEGENGNDLLTLHNTLYLRVALEIYVEHRMPALWG